MAELTYLIQNFFTHKDFLKPAHELAGTLFTPLHLVFATLLLALVIFLGLRVARKDERTVRRVFFVIWCAAVVLEITKIVWET